MTDADIFYRTKFSLLILFERDHLLFSANVNERSISHKLAEYLQQQFPEYNIDCEYNRHGDDVKKLPITTELVSQDDLEAKSVYPDIIIHQRNSDKSNLIVIEIKKVGQPIDYDIRKLKAFTGNLFQYYLGLLLIIDVNHKRVADVKAYKNGIEDAMYPWFVLKELGYGL